MKKILLVVIILVLVVVSLRIGGRKVVADSRVIGRGMIVAEVFGTGTLEAKTRASLGAQISGRVEKIHVDQGSKVVKGQVLVELDNDDLRRQVDIASAVLAEVEAALAKAKAELGKSKAVEVAARRDYERDKALKESKVQAESELDKSFERWSVAKAERAKTEASIVEAEARLQAARQTLEYHKARLAYSKVTAPFDGLIVRRLRDPGDVVVPGSTILELIATDVLWVSAWVDETEMKALKVGQPARVVFRSCPGELFDGEVARLGREVDRETREFIVDVRVLRLPGNWAVGQRAEVYIETARKSDAIVLPLSFLRYRDGQPGVMLLSGDGATLWRPVGLGLRGRKEVEISSGLAEGDVVVAP